MTQPKLVRSNLKSKETLRSYRKVVHDLYAALRKETLLALELLPDYALLTTAEVSLAIMHSAPDKGYVNTLRKIGRLRAEKIGHSVWFTAATVRAHLWERDGSGPVLRCAGLDSMSA